jgi:hypothetical protein
VQRDFLAVWKLFGSEVTSRFFPRLMTAVWTLNVVAFWLLRLATAYLDNLKSLAAVPTFISSHFFFR